MVYLFSLRFIIPSRHLHGGTTGSFLRDLRRTMDPSKPNRVLTSVGTVCGLGVGLAESQAAGQVDSDAALAFAVHDHGHDREQDHFGQATEDG